MALVTNAVIRKGNSMNIIKNWKEESGYTYSFIAELLGTTTAKVQRYENGQIVEPKILIKLKGIYRLDRLIAQEPNDIILLKYELCQLTGLEMEDFEKARLKAEEKIEREAQKTLPEEPTNIRKVALKVLKKIRENGYNSVYRVNVSYDADAIDAEIARKTFNIKRKKEIHLEKMALNA